MLNKGQKGTATVRIISENGCESLDFLTQSVKLSGSCRLFKIAKTVTVILLLTLKMSRIIAAFNRINNFP